TSRVACETSCARPIAMPPETPMPCNTKLTVARRGRAPMEKRRGAGKLDCFAEAIDDELHHRAHGRALVGPIGLEPDRAAHGRSQHHHGEHAAGTCALASAHQRYIAPEL